MEERSVGGVITGNLSGSISEQLEFHKKYYAVSAMVFHKVINIILDYRVRLFLTLSES